MRDAAGHADRVQSMGGYRRVRTLGSGPAGEVFLARAEETADPPVVIRLADDARAEAEVAALTAVDSPHVVPLTDLFGSGDGRTALVFPRLPGGSLAQLLQRRARLAPGEATTVLVGVARGLAALHAAGRTHGGLRTDCVAFAADGTPVLTGLGASAANSLEGERADRVALAAVAAAVLARTEDGDRIAAGVGDEASPERVEALMFDAAEPVPVDLTAGPELSEPSFPSRAGQVPLVGAVLPRPGLRKRASAAARAVRPRFWHLAGGAAAALVAALVLVPSGGDGAAAPGEDPAPQSTAGSAPAPSPPSIDRAVLAGDDPMPAAVVLAAGRDACRAAGSAECLGGVLEPGSALLEADTAALGTPAEPTLAAHQPGAAGAVPEGAAQRIGDAAMVSFPPVTLLLLRVEGEWRLRDVFAAEPPSL